MWSKHSRRIVPITRSATAFAFGAWIGVKIVWMPIRDARAMKSDP
jgi:hypothetical protein